jgi:nucleotide-binding universal stress UspA family protein
MKILLAIDGSACSDEAIAEVIKRSWPEQTEVKVITVFELPVVVGIEPWGAGPMYFHDLENAGSSAAKEVLENTLTRLKASSDGELKITGEVLQGSPGQVIVETAEEWGADLIVMGSRGLGVWNRLLLGSVSNAVTHHAKCSVEIVRRRPGMTIGA